MNKHRHEIILDLIRKYDIENQTELVKRLNDLGFDVTQSTVSRDIEKLKIVKVKDGGKYKFSVVEKTINYQEKFVRIITDTFKAVDVAKNIVVYKTISGMAMATAAALDGLEFPEIVGSIAGDDVIFIATKNDDTALLLKNKIEVIVKKEI